MMVTTFFAFFTLHSTSVIRTFYSHCTGKVAEIQRMYPDTEDYRCHCPSVILKCIFPRDALVAGWYVSANGIQRNCDGYDNHMVDSTNFSSGVLFLQMNNTELQNNTYSCAAVYSDSSTAESRTVTLPRFEGQL